ncbi:MAG: sulfite exporter TauE/SafE family protein [Cyanobacteria bacterium P01_D01_bin.2]
MPLTSILAMALAGLAAGILAGFLGIGGGVLMVPMLLMLGLDIDHATATSLLAILITASAGSWQNWRMGYLRPKQVLFLAAPAICLVLIGTEVGGLMSDFLRQVSFGCLLLANLYLVSLKKRAASTHPTQLSPNTSRLVTGGAAGFMAGLFGVGGGVIMVPLQLLLLNTEIKQAVRNSLGVIVLTSLIACIHNSIKGDIVPLAGVLMGLGGLVGVQISTRFLPKLSEQIVTKLFRSLLLILAAYVFWQAWSVSR